MLLGFCVSVEGCDLTRSEKGSSQLAETVSMVSRAENLKKNTDFIRSLQSDTFAYNFFVLTEVDDRQGMFMSMVSNYYLYNCFCFVDDELVVCRMLRLDIVVSC